MQNCHKCNNVVISAVSGICDNCGALLDTSAEKNQLNQESDGLDFVVTEASNNSPEFVDGKSNYTSDDNDLSIESTSDLIENEAQNNVNVNSHPSSFQQNPDDEPIGNSAPHLPEFSQEPKLEISKPELEVNSDFVDNSHSEIDLPPSSSDKITELSKEDLKSINNELNTSETYLSDNEKSELLSKLGNIPKKKIIEEPSPPKPSLEESSLPAPKMADHNKGIAYFHKNYIQIVSALELHNGDDLVINDREFVLKQKSLNKNVLYSAVASLFIIVLIFVGSLFVGDISNGEGYIVGVVFNTDGSPYLNGTTIRFPEDGNSVKSNAQGFFKSKSLSSGPHKIEYLLDGKVVKVDYATVIEGDVSNIMLYPDDIAENTQQATKTAQSKPIVTTAASTSKPTKSAPTKQISKKSKRAASKPGKVVLAASVEGAKFVLDGKVLGAGNLTYSKIKAGKHSYAVSKEGYQEAAGTFTLKSAEKKTLKITLNPIETANEIIQFDESDFYLSGVTAYKEKKYYAAIEDLNEAIKIKPSYAEAYEVRANSFRALKQNEEAHEDFIKSAEIYQFNKNYNAAITSYNRAIEMNKKSLPAYLGRGYLYMAKGEEIAALTDYDAAIKIDKKNFQAQFGAGEARFRQGNYKKAIKHFKKAKDIDKNNPLVYQYLMVSYLGRDDAKNVIKTFDKFRHIATEKQLTDFLLDNKYSGVIDIIDQ